MEHFVVCGSYKEWCAQSLHVMLDLTMLKPATSKCFDGFWSPQRQLCMRCAIIYIVHHLDCMDAWLYHSYYPRIQDVRPTKCICMITCESGFCKVPQRSSPTQWTGLVHGHQQTVSTAIAQIRHSHWLDEFTIDYRHITLRTMNLIESLSTWTVPRMSFALDLGSIESQIWSNILAFSPLPLVGHSHSIYHT